MERKLTDLEKSALRCANKEGLIAIPSGTASETDSFLKTLLSLRAAGLVSRAPGLFYRPYTLTKLGKSVTNLGADRASASSATSPPSLPA